MNTSKFLLTHNDTAMVDLVRRAEKTTLAAWAIDCALRVIPHFERHHPNDRRPRNAIEMLQAWLTTGVFRMSVIRKASLDAHAAARDVGEDNAARSAARACGQAVATAHVPSHALGAALYAQQAVHRAADPATAETATAKERDWQYQRLLELNTTSTR